MLRKAVGGNQPILGLSSGPHAAENSRFVADRELADGDIVEGEGWTLAAVATPGHTANHLAFALPQENALFSGDHVMAWSTTVVAPPDGSMGDYMAALARLGQRGERVYWPGHGGPVTQPERFVRALLHHRRQREASILNRVAQGDGRIADIVARLYEGLDPALVVGASLSVLAHLEDLADRALVRPRGGTGLDAEWEEA
jgi:glyoxylase-like metal-dependent hydrolase (beta-lactamase superfamily II)